MVLMLRLDTFRRQNNDIQSLHLNKNARVFCGHFTFFRQLLIHFELREMPLSSSKKHGGYLNGSPGGLTASQSRQAVDILRINAFGIHTHKPANYRIVISCPIYDRPVAVSWGLPANHSLLLVLAS